MMLWCCCEGETIPTLTLTSPQTIVIWENPLVPPPGETELPVTIVTTGLQWGRSTDNIGFGIRRLRRESWINFVYTTRPPLVTNAFLQFTMGYDNGQNPLIDDPANICRLNYGVADSDAFGNDWFDVRDWTIFQEAAATINPFQAILTLPITAGLNHAITNLPWVSGQWGFAVRIFTDRTSPLEAHNALSGGSTFYRSATVQSLHVT